MTRGRRLAWLVLVAALTGCGVRPSGVISGGPAPTDHLAPPVEQPKDVTLYFLAGSSLTPVLRPARQRLRPVQALALLEQGPGDAERAANLTSEVPSGLDPVTITTEASGNVDVAVSADVTTLSAAAVDQIVCTVRDAVSTPAPITLTSGAAIRGPRTCPLPAGAPAQAPGGG